MSSVFRGLPAVHRLLDEPELAAFTQALGSAAVKAAVVDVLDDVRRHGTIAASAPPAYTAIVERIAAQLTRDEADGMLAVINGTGILLHTNLGRAPLAREAVDAMSEIGGGYANVEFDLESGTRGSRYDRVIELLRRTTGAEDGLLVNNCAAAMLLVLDTYARGREVIVARNELIEIGGGFRLPEVITRSGARLIEVGTTNKVYLRDVERALTVDTALLLRTHPSNFALSGFVATVAARELSDLGRRAGIPTLEDLGTGALVDLAAYGLPHERTVREAVADGIDVVTFSGDKLLGGPQAGVIVGKRAVIARLRSNPLLRALRVDKATLAAMAATLRLYTLPAGLERIPLYRMLALSRDSLRSRARAVRDSLGDFARYVTPIDTVGFVGGGTLPDVTVPSAGLAIESPYGGIDAFARRLRRARPAIVGRISEQAVILDMRTIPATGDASVSAILTRELAVVA